MSAEQPDGQLCGDVDELDYGIWFECDLLPGHAGDHQAVHTWTNKPYGPALPPPPPGPHTEWLQDVYAKMINRQLELLAEGNALLNPESVIRAVVNRDKLGV